MLVQGKEAKLYLNIAELLRNLTVGELFKISCNRFEVADDFEKLARDITNSKTFTSDHYVRGLELVLKVDRVNGIEDLIRDYYWDDRS